MKTGLFPDLPAKLADLSDTELSELLAEHTEAARLIDADDADFLKDLSADEILEQYRKGAEQIKALRSEQTDRVTAQETYAEEKARISAEVNAEAEPVEETPAEETPAEETPAETPAEETPAEETPVEETPAETPAVEETPAETPVEETPTEPQARERELVTAAAAEPEKPRLRRPPAPSADRVVVSEAKELAFVASGIVPTTPAGAVLKTKEAIAEACASMARALGRPDKRADGREDVYRVARLDYSDNYPEERRLGRDGAANAEKIAAIGSPFVGGSDALAAMVASGGFCAPLEPIYSMPNLASQARPVKAAYPSFRAERGGINVPTPTIIGDITTAITVIEESEDALGGTFATKGCQDMDCPDYTETAVTIISHCREFGNLNAMAWPEKIRHENDLTMAAHARTAETYLLDRIKAQSVEVTNGAETLSALVYLVDAIVKAKFGISGRLRLDRGVRFQALLPAVVEGLLELDTIQTVDGNRFKSIGELNAYLGDLGIDVTYYLDSPSTGTSQIADASQAGSAALDGLPDTIQWAIHPHGTFLHLDMAELNLGIVRDSTLNSTNDFQNFGETFENIARIGPAQAALWVTSDLCANGMLAPAGTARTCD